MSFVFEMIEQKYMLSVIGEWLNNDAGDVLSDCCSTVIRTFAFAEYLNDDV
jgi:hypothetical protein